MYVHIHVCERRHAYVCWDFLLLETALFRCPCDTEAAVQMLSGWHDLIQVTPWAWGQAGPSPTVHAAPAHAAWSHWQPHQCPGRLQPEILPLQGAEQPWPSIPPAGGKGAAALPQQGISCINRLGADLAWRQVSENLTFYLIRPLPRQSWSWQQSCVAGSHSMERSEHSLRSAQCPENATCHPNAVAARVATAGGHHAVAARARAGRGGSWQFRHLAARWHRWLLPHLHWGDGGRKLLAATSLSPQASPEHQ